MGRPQTQTDPGLEELGRLIKRERSSKGMTISELALRADVSRTWLSFLERGQHGTTGAPMRPSYSEVRKLAEPLGLSADRLSTLAGYHDDQQRGMVNPYSTLGESTARDSRAKPSLLRDLEDLEEPGDLTDDLLGRLATELPVFTFLFHLATNPAMTLVGVSSEIGTDTSSRLYTLAKGPRDMAAITRIGTYGWHTVSTVALIVHLIGLKRSWRLIGIEDDKVLAEKSFPDGTPSIDIEIAYGTSALIHNLRKGRLDAIALPSHPYISDRPEFRRLHLLADLTMSQVGDYPQTVVVTHRDVLKEQKRRQQLLQELDDISYNNERAREQFQDALQDPLSRLGLGNVNQESVPLMPSGLISEVAFNEFDEVNDVANKIVGLSEIARAINLLGSDFEPVTRQSIIDSTVTRFDLANWS
ncbi:MAG: XRE family transcriptional regulator [Mycobacterium kyogaense]|uniref:XRE family transcriptional regulator n=1 Tax=Mycobacterium kyogaense TaxID=2212479 RepID=UPI002FFC3880